MATGTWRADIRALGDDRDRRGAPAKRRAHAGSPWWYRPTIVLADVVSAGVAAVVAATGMPGLVRADVTSGGAILAVTAVVLAVVGWPIVLAAVVGRGDLVTPSAGTWAQVARAAVVYLAALTLVGGAAGADITYQPILVSVGLLVVMSAVGRWAAASRLRSWQRTGVVVRRVLAVGAGMEISALIDRLASDVSHPFVVVGACVEGDGSQLADVPVLGELSEADLCGDGLRDDNPARTVLAALDRVEADIVCVTPGSRFRGDRLRSLVWALDERGVEVTAALGVEEVDEHRLRLSRAGEVALLQVAPPRPSRARIVGKAVADRVLAALVLVMLLPVLLAIAVAVRVSSPGPVFYRQQRVGQNGRLFSMIKFRTMCVDAHFMREALLDTSDGDGPMFKLRDDPRVTRVGRVLRTYSLDELPQLFNVLRGEMSLVGPRPPLPEEVDTYDAVERRRLRAVPGMTGLWQVSGRSNLSWDETVRLDLRYVDNWTLGGDLKLLSRTAAVVFRGEGAY